MAGLNPEQRNYYYLLEAARTGIHKPILAALYTVQRRPVLSDGETGLGISPANRIPPDQVNTFAEQVQFAANTIRSLTDKLTAQGWKGTDLWNAAEGRYSDRFIQTVALGYIPPVSEPTSARLESSNADDLKQALLEDLAIDFSGSQLPQNLDYLDSALLRFVERLPRYYLGLGYQQEAVLEAVRIWRKLNTREAAVASLLRVAQTAGLLRIPENDPGLLALDATRLDQPLIQFIQQISPFFAGYPHQREALVRLVQLWRQLDSREEAIASLQNNPSAETNIQIVDPALMAFVQRVPQFYQSRGDQRNALTETYRLWMGLATRTEALTSLGVNAQILTASNPDRTQLINAATQLDRALLSFMRRVPVMYRETDPQRESLIRLVQLWRQLDTRERTLRSRPQ
nr:peptidase M15A [Leptolyngbya ohadii]